MLCDYFSIILQLNKTMPDLANKHRRRVRSLIFSAATVFLLAACGDKQVATTEIEFEANRMFDILYSRELEVEKRAREGEKPGWDIIVKEGWFGSEEASVATQILNDYGLPRVREPLPEVSGPYGITSEAAIRKRQNREKEMQIERQLYDLPGVIKVGVMIGQPENGTLEILSRNQTPPSASVLIVQKEMPPKFSDADVKSQVSGTIPDLKPESINITTTYQPLREVPTERLNAQRRSNRIYALGSGLIALLAATLGALWYFMKRRQRPAESETKQLEAGDDAPELAALNRPALESGDKDF